MKGFIRINRVAASFEIWLDDTFPFAKMKVKVIEQPNGEFFAVANLAVRNRVTRQPEGVAGLGTTIDEALEDVLKRFMSESQSHRPSNGFTENDFEWSAPEDF